MLPIALAVTVLLSTYVVRIEVIFGCGVGIAVSWLMSRVWPVVPAHQAAAAPKPGA